MKQLSLIAVLVLLVSGALLAWGSPSATKKPQVRWSYMQIQGSKQTLLRPSTNESGQFDETATARDRKGIAFANSVFDKEFTSRLQQAGQSGWELVSVTSASHESGNVMAVDSTAYLKRQIR